MYDHRCTSENWADLARVVDLIKRAVQSQTLLWVWQGLINFGFGIALIHDPEWQDAMVSALSDHMEAAVGLNCWESGKSKNFL